jgi:ABC-type dipeptide/oligopeptide/nickel transport system ATPase component
MMKPFVLGFYGESGTGKTTLIVDIISRLKSQGFKIASVKITDKMPGYMSHFTCDCRAVIPISDMRRDIEASGIFFRIFGQFLTIHFRSE